MQRSSKRRPARARKVAHAATAAASLPTKQVRGAELVENVLGATLEELGRVGYELLSMEHVAERAGVNKVTLYRRWPAKRDLVEAAIRRIADEASTVPDTGSLRGDVLDLLRTVRDLMRAPTHLALFRMLIGHALGDLRDICESLRCEKDGECFVVYERAIARGELARGTNIELLHTLLFATVWNRSVLDHRPCTDDELDEIATMILDGVHTREKPRVYRRVSPSPRSAAVKRPGRASTRK